MTPSQLSDDLPIEAYLTGQRLYGNDFSPEAIAAWFRDEKEGYYQLGAHDREAYRYGYHAINQAHGFRWLPSIDQIRLLGIGAAYGEELVPVLDRCVDVTVLEPADGFSGEEIQGVPARYVKPDPSGRLPFADAAFDLITCFSVLHHIPNVSTVVREMSRCVRPGGYVLLREPTISMGDWRAPRRGLTKHERGIPLAIFRSFIAEAGFEVVREARCMFSLTSRLRYVVRGSVFNAPWAVALDEALCRLPIWSPRYHPRHAFDKLRPTAVAYVLRKPGGSPE